MEEGVTFNGVQMAGLNLKLPVGAANETVTVTAAPMMLNSESASIAAADSFSVRRNSLLNATPGVANYATLAAASIAPNSTGAAFDDYFAYNLSEPITIRKNESALVPILQAKIDTELCR